MDIIIQARMNSCRLPGKILMPFGSNTVLEYLVDRALALGDAQRVIIATTVGAQDDAVEKLCRKRGYLLFRGSEVNVLERFYQTATKFGSEVIVRLTADNPFTDFSEMKRMALLLNDQQLDYISNHNSGMPIGTGSEVFTFKALTQAYKEAQNDYDKEHVTPYFYQTQPGKFKQQTLFPLRLLDAEDVRLTLDTEADYRSLAEAEAYFNGKANSLTTKELINFFRHNG